jgi:hypothetical protein
MTAVLRPVELKRHQKVRAWVDLPGVPIGTPGKVLQVSGVSWIRYRVLFANGVELGLLDGRHIVARNDFVPPDERVEEEVVEVVAADESDSGGGSAGEGNEFGVPGYLLERSAAARARRAAL